MGGLNSVIARENPIGYSHHHNQSQSNGFAIYLENATLLIYNFVLFYRLKSYPAGAPECGGYLTETALL